ncbi:hypothetical protein ACJX0J_025133, partial [Zea mays]
MGPIGLFFSFALFCFLFIILHGILVTKKKTIDGYPLFMLPRKVTFRIIFILAPVWRERF